MKPSKAEIVARSVLFGSLALLVCCNLSLQYLFNKIPIQEIVYLYYALFIVFGLLIVGLAATVFLSRKRVKAIREINIQLAAASQVPPDFASCDTSQSLFALYWTVDYKTGVILNYRYVVTTPRPWIFVAFAEFLLLAPILMSPGQKSVVMISGLALLVVVGVILFTMLVIARTVKPYYASNGQLRHIGLIVDPQGIRYLVGQTIVSKPWFELKTIRLANGVVMMTHNDGRRMIPDYAFHSREDAKAFVASAKALKAGAPPPSHDWSAYKPEVPVTEGAWPPAIT